MLYWLSKLLMPYLHGLRVFQYLTFRSICSCLTALLIALLVGPSCIRWLSRAKVGQTIREDGPQSHFSKKNTPTMGGALILIAISVSILLWGDLENRFIWIVLLTTLGFGLIGFYDDYIKLVKQDYHGLRARYKYT